MTYYGNDFPQNLVQTGFLEPVSSGVYTVRVVFRNSSAICSGQVFEQALGDSITVCRSVLMCFRSIC
jgi:hypothetical protein